MTKHLMLWAALTAAMTVAAPAFAGGLNLTVDGVRNGKGSVLVLIFDDEDAYDRLDWQKAAQYAEIPSRRGRVSHSFPDLTRGPYAVFVFHDENGDQDLNFSGDRALEGAGVSVAASSTSAPSLSASSFAEAAVAPGNVTVRIVYEQ